MRFVRLCSAAQRRCRARDGPTRLLFDKLERSLSGPLETVYEDQLWRVFGSPDAVLQFHYADS
jgi:hypothetical protein